MSLAQRERAALVESMRAAGPHAPTLCSGWDTTDLAAHLIARERRPDSGPGLMISRLAPYTERVRLHVAERPWLVLLDEIAAGPPVWSPFRPLDKLVNTTEMFVHHEDVRRGSVDWEPRRLTDQDEATLWRAARPLVKRAYHKAVGEVVLRASGAEELRINRGRGRIVVVSGRASEVVMHVFGRDAVRLDVQGDPADIVAFNALDRSI